MHTFTIEGFCDWCQTPSFVTKHEYVDGKCHHSCEKCLSFAIMDVRQFNLAEIEYRAKSLAQS
ncbi:hypothetical protein [Vibrio hangzhouensis]|uniref:hypothetical protein n=1 Tax=Vibrio hangzhouensis TaxID=462991 RepID=UPI001C93D844|nr:hypothetical protein [Vibrio hangzhouensis]MBY6196570.1 hypothetical protein [Vibrio hangzhouensis]